MILLTFLFALFLPTWAADPACPTHSILATYRGYTNTHFWPEPTAICVDPSACDSYWVTYQFCKSALEIDATTAQPPYTDTRPFQHVPSGCANFAQALGTIYDICGWLNNGFPTTIVEPKSAQLAAIETGSPQAKKDQSFCPDGYHFLTSFKDTYDYHMCCPINNNQMLLPNNGSPRCCDKGDKNCRGLASDTKWCSSDEEVTDYFGTKGCRVRRSGSQQRHIPWSSGSPFPMHPLPTGTFPIATGSPIIEARTNTDFTQYDTGPNASGDWHSKSHSHPGSATRALVKVTSHDIYPTFHIPVAPTVPTPPNPQYPTLDATGLTWVPFATETASNPTSSHYHPPSTTPYVLPQSPASSKGGPHPIITAKDALPENANAPTAYITSLGPGSDWGSYPDPAYTDAPSFHCGFNGCRKDQLEVWVGRDCLCTSTTEQLPVHPAITGFISDVAERDAGYTRYSGPHGASKSGTTTVTITIPRSPEPTTFSTITSAAKLPDIMTGHATLTVGGTPFQWIDGICGFCNLQSSNDFMSGNGMPFGVSSDQAKKFCSASAAGCPSPTHT